MGTYHQLVCRTDGPYVRVDVNDVSIVRWEQPAGGQTTEHLNAWLVPGVNRMRVVVAWPPGGRAEAGAGVVDVKVHELRGEEAERTDRVIARFTWPPRERSPDDALLEGGSLTAAEAERAIRLATRRGRHEALVDFSPAHPPPTQLWKKAGPIRLTHEVSSEIVTRAAELQRTADRMDLDRVMEMLAYRNEDLARAFYVHGDDVIGELGAFLLMSLPDDVLDGTRALDPSDLANEAHDALESDLQVHLVADGKLAWVTRPGFGPALRTKGLPRFETHVYLTAIDGAWMIVR